MPIYRDLGECTTEDEKRVARYIVLGIVRQYLRQKHRMSFREDGDSVEKCSNPDNQSA